MNAKIFPIFILLAAIAISGTAPAVYAEEIEIGVVHEAPVRDDSGPAIAPAPEQETNNEPLVIAPGPLETIAATGVSDPNAGIPVVIMEEIRPDKPIEHDASAGEKAIAPAPVIPAPDEKDAEPVIAPAPDTDGPVIEAEERSQIIGGDRDGHGCLGTAGYLWDEDKQACVRPWSGEVQSETVAVPHGELIGLEEPAASEGGQETAEASFAGPLEGLWQAIAGLFQTLFGWLM